MTWPVDSRNLSHRAKPGAGPAQWFCPAPALVCPQAAARLYPIPAACAEHVSTGLVTKGSWRARSRPPSLRGSCSDFWTLLKGKGLQPLASFRFPLGGDFCSADPPSPRGLQPASQRASRTLPAWPPGGRGGPGRAGVFLESSILGASAAEVALWCSSLPGLWEGPAPIRLFTATRWAWA